MGLCIVHQAISKLSAFADDILNISKTEQVRFETLVNTNPTTGPLGLIVGVPGINGPGESVADISESDVFLNAGRVGKERLKVEANSHSGGDSLIAAFGYRTCFFFLDLSVGRIFRMLPLLFLESGRT